MKQSFDRLFHTFSLLVSFWGMVALFATTQVSPLAIGICLGLFLLAVFRNRIFLGTFPGIWTPLNIVAFLLLFLLAMNDLFHALLYLLFYLQINRLFTARQPREYTQIYVVSFFQVALASALTYSLNFAFIFIGFLFLMVIGLGLLMMYKDRGELMRLFPRVLRRRHIKLIKPHLYERFRGREFWSFATAAFLMLVMLTVLFFLIIPRLPAQQLMRSLKRPGPSMTGLSEEMELTDPGSIMLDPTIVARVIPLDATLEQPSSSLLLRGSSLNQFDGERWRPSRELRLRSSHEHQAEVEFKFEKHPDGKNLSYEVVLESTRSPYLLGVERPYKFRFPVRFQLLINEEGLSLRTPLKFKEPFSYQVKSYQQPEPKEKFFHFTGYLGLSEERRARLLQLYLQLPEEAWVAEIAAMTQEVVKEAPNPFAQALAIERFLRTNCRYSLDVPSVAGKNQIEAFLFDTREGHCELFASTMALMLRSLGIPCRLVQGYFTQEWNKVGGYFVTRQSDAHVWVEAWFPGYEWIRFDPTPAAQFFRQRSFSPAYYAISHLFDALKVNWYNYVIDYDRQKQFLLTYPVLGQFWDLRQWLIFKLASSSASLGQLRINLIVLGFIIALAILFLFLLYQLLRRPPRRVRPGFLRYRGSAARVRFYLQILQRLHRQGWRRPQGQTPLEFAYGLSGMQKRFDLFPEITALYYRLRYSPRALISPDEEELISSFLTQL